MGNLFYAQSTRTVVLRLKVMGGGGGGGGMRGARECERGMKKKGERKIKQKVCVCGGGGGGMEKGRKG